MKKSILILLFALVMSSSVFCQEIQSVTDTEKKLRRNEFYLSYGTPSMAGVVSDVFSSFLDALLSIINNAEEIEKSFCCATVGYNFYFNNNIGLGAVVNYEKLFGADTFTLMGKFKWFYDKSEVVRAYGNISAGCIFIGDKTVYPIADFTLIGVDFKINDNFNLFIENSFPISAILKAGISVKF